MKGKHPLLAQLQRSHPSHERVGLDGERAYENSTDPPHVETPANAVPRLKLQFSGEDRESAGGDESDFPPDKSPADELDTEQRYRQSLKPVLENLQASY